MGKQREEKKCPARCGSKEGRRWKGGCVSIATGYGRVGDSQRLGRKG